MAYATGSIVGTGPVGLLNALATFLTDNGWTQDLLTDDNTEYYSFTGHDPTGRRLHVHKTAADGTVMNFNLRAVVRAAIFQDNYGYDYKFDGTHQYSEISGIGLNGSTGYNVANTWDGQPGYSGRTGLGTGDKTGVCMSLQGSDIPAYYFFQNGDTVHVVVEYSSGFFEHMVFGCIKKNSVFTGGQYFASMCPAYYAGYWSYYRDGSGKIAQTNSYCNFMAHCFQSMGIGAVRLTMDTVDTWRWQGTMGRDGAAYADCLQFSGMRNNIYYVSIYESPGLAQYLRYRNPNHFNGLSVIQPNHVVVKDAGGFYRYLGVTEGSNWINVTNYAPADEISISEDTYKVFPMWSKDQTQWYQPVDYYHPVGLAIKKVV